MNDMDESSEIKILTNKSLPLPNKKSINKNLLNNIINTMDVNSLIIPPSERLMKQLDEDILNESKIAKKGIFKVTVEPVSSKFITLSNSINCHVLYSIEMNGWFPLNENLTHYITTNDYKEKDGLNTVVTGILLENRSRDEPFIGSIHYQISLNI